MVSCTQCINHGVVCYYDKAQSVKCAACLRHQRKCDGSFSVEELRRVSEQKKQLQSKVREKRHQLQKLRQALADAENETNSLDESIVMLEDIANRMLRHKIMALGAFNNVVAMSGSEQEVALAEPDFVLDGLPYMEVPDLSFLDDSLGGIQV